MHYNTFNKNNSTLTTQVMCAIVFCLFSFAWLYWFQADVLAVAQHLLSNGITHYNRVIGAILITLILQALQVLISLFVKLYRRSHALTYLPSMLLLAVISDVEPDDNLHLSFALWYWVVPLILVAWGGLVWLAKHIIPFPSDKDPTGLLSQRTWVNMLTMAAMMLCVAAFGNSNAVFHYRAHLEVCLLQKDTEEALRTGKDSWETDRNLTMLRAYALSLKGELGEHLFEYPVSGSGADLVPLPTSKSRTLMLSQDSIFLHLGALPKGRMTANRYYDLLERDSLATDAVADYRLCGMLMDRDIDNFAKTLPQYYEINDSLPKHYKEALTMYTHMRTTPTVIYHSEIHEEDWSDFQKLETRYTDDNERKIRVEDRYATSYWYYFYYR